MEDLIAEIVATLQGKCANTPDFCTYYENNVYEYHNDGFLYYCIYYGYDDVTCGGPYDPICDVLCDDYFKQIVYTDYSDEDEEVTYKCDITWNSCDGIEYTNGCEEVCELITSIDYDVDNHGTTIVCPTVTNTCTQKVCQDCIEVCYNTTVTWTEYGTGDHIYGCDKECTEIYDCQDNVVDYYCIPIYNPQPEVVCYDTYSTVLTPSGFEVPKLEHCCDYYYCGNFDHTDCECDYPYG